MFLSPTSVGSSGGVFHQSVSSGTGGVKSINLSSSYQNHHNHNYQVPQPAHSSKKRKIEHPVRNNSFLILIIIALINSINLENNYRINYFKFQLLKSITELI